MRGVDTGSGQLRLCRGSSQSACCMVSETRFLRLMFTPHERSCLRVIWLDNHSQDHGRSQVHICRHVHGTSSHTTATTTATEIVYKNRLTPVKCPHLLSYRIQLLSPPARPNSVEFSGRMGCDTVFALPATLSTASSLDSTPTNGRRITLQPNLLVATRPALYIRRLAPHSTLACPQHHASNSHRETHSIPRWQTATCHGCFVPCSTFN